MTDLTYADAAELETGASGGQGTPGANGTSTFASSAAATASRAEEIAANAAREVESRANQARDWALTQSDTVRTQVLDKPFVSVGTAFAAGIVFGLLLRR